MKILVFMIMTTLMSCTEEKKPDFLDRYNVGESLHDFQSANPKIKLLKVSTGKGGCGPEEIKEHNCKQYWVGPRGIRAPWGSTSITIFTRDDDVIYYFKKFHVSNTTGGDSAYLNAIANNTLEEVTGGVQPHYVQKWKRQDRRGFTAYSTYWVYDDFFAITDVFCKKINGKSQNLKDCFPFGYRVSENEVPGKRLIMEGEEWKAQDHEW